MPSFLHSCIIQTKTKTRDGLGKEVEAWTTDRAGVPCRFYSPSPQIVILDGARAPEESVRVAFPAYLTAAGLTGRRIVTTAHGYEGTYWIRTVVPKPGAGGNIDHYECSVEWLPPEAI